MLFNFDVTNLQHWINLKYFQMKRAKQLFQVLIVDPPWGNTGHKLAYPTMTDEEILKMPVEQVQEEGFIFLWVTNNKLQAGLDFLRVHGYQHIEDVVWNKKDSNGNVLRRIGYTLLHTHELCLVGRKGRPMDMDHYVQRQMAANDISE
jgi:mRNA m6A methyltransferase catalytic subunit